MVLVYGASTLLGQQICRRLRERHMPVRALVCRRTSPSNTAALKRLDVELITADLNESPAVAAACSGAQAVICADPAVLPCRDEPPLDASGAHSLIELASALGVARFVLVTVPEHFVTPCALVTARREAFARLEAHGMDYVVLEAGFFMETWLSPEMGFNYSEGTAVVYGGGIQKVPWVSRNDVAEVAARSVDVDHRRKHRVRVAALEHMSPFDVIQHFEELRGEPIEVTRISESELRAEHERARDPVERVRAAMKVEFARGLALRGDYTDIPVVLSSVRDYAQRVVGAQTSSEETWRAGTSFG